MLLGRFNDPSRYLCIRRGASALRESVRGLHDVRVSNSLVSNPSTSLGFLLNNTQSPNTPRVLQWYSCGPTVYDDAHLGHARTYVSTDVIRRILQDFFHVPVNFALGITDVDDKIIARAKEKGQADTWQHMTAHARPFEESFFRDMDALNIRRPNAVLRVSEHMPEIEAYVRRLQAGGAAYEVPGRGTYFDTARVLHSYGKLGQLPPAAHAPPDRASAAPVSSAGAAAEAAAEDDDAGASAGKRSFRDFALWKAVKVGEPHYRSAALGDGRPGWHIECSAMTHAYFGPSFDVHSGGVDLRFPHHTNEIVQSEAYARIAHPELPPGAEWVRLWLHTGHLHIHGLKMSKSLKNFISIGQFLAQSSSPHAAVDFRMFCLQHRYSAALHFSDDRVHEAGKYRDRLTCLLDLQHAAARTGGAAAKATRESAALTSSLHSCQRGLRAQLADDFNTPAALSAISALVGQAIAYGQTLLAQGACSPLPLEPLTNTAHWVRHTFAMLGVEIPTSAAAATADKREAAGAEPGAGAGGEREMHALLAFRSKVRTAALAAAKAKGGDADRGAAAAVKEVLQACDAFRDEEAPRLGYTVRDVGGVSTFSRADVSKTAG